MNGKKFLEAIEKIDDKYINEALSYSIKVSSERDRWIRRVRGGVIAACVGLLCVGAALVLYRGKASGVEDFGDETNYFFATGKLQCVVPIGAYGGMYAKVNVGGNTVLSASEFVEGKVGEVFFDTWYYVSGHTDIQYLIRNDSGEYSLWKFQCFDSEEYPYRDVLELVYQIDSEEKISKIEVNPPTFDSTVSGEAIQKEIGRHVITERRKIQKLYDILASMTCYGENQWKKVDFHGVDDEGMWLGRYLTVVTSYGNEIDGLKYTGVSDMFYEYSGIVYQRLTKKQAESVCEILKIDRNKKF